MKKFEPRQLAVFEFVDQKLEINDVEPSYRAIVDAKLTLKQRYAVTFGEGLVDHLGLQMQLAESKDFWKEANAQIRRPLRGGARRYFRGDVATKALRKMERRFPDLTDFFSGLPDNYREARRYIVELPQMGDFAAFKIADMAERVCNVPISFKDVWYNDFGKLSRNGLRLASDYLLIPESLLYRRLLNRNWSRNAPPWNDRPLNAQELETVLCNYGHKKWRPPGTEIKAVRQSLKGFGVLAEHVRFKLTQEYD